MKIWEVIRDLETIQICLNAINEVVRQARYHIEWDEEYPKPISSIAELSAELQNEIKQIYEAFITSNFIEFLPANYSSILSIGFVSFS